VLDTDSACRLQEENIVIKWIEYMEESCMPSKARKKELKAKLKECQKQEAEVRQAEANMEVQSCRWCTVSTSRCGRSACQPPPDPVPTAS
jgi:hypothetical protein